MTIYMIIGIVLYTAFLWLYAEWRLKKMEEKFTAARVFERLQQATQPSIPMGPGGRGGMSPSAAAATVAAKKYAAAAKHPIDALAAIKMKELYGYKVVTHEEYMKWLLNNDRLP